MQQKRKSWKTNAIVLIAIWLVLLIASLTILSAVVTPFLRTLQTQNLVSLDWAGYSVSSDVLYPQPLVMSVSGSWIVPAVTASAGNTFSVAWIGIGGQSDSTLIQTGSSHSFVGGEPSYSLWYEMLPENIIPIEYIQVSPGDRITASIALTDSNANEWLIQISNTANGQGFSETFQYNSSRLTAEWIVERPTVNNQISNLTNFGTITFIEASAQVGSTKGTISSFPNYEIVMQNRQNTMLVKVSDLSRDGSSFSVDYL